MNAAIRRSHLERKAMVYIRQSTAAQVIENSESTLRQYALADRAKSLGWSTDSIEIIDEDLGRSGATVAGRTGLSKIASQVAEGRVGAILALEVSRWARDSLDCRTSSNSARWPRCW